MRKRQAITIVLIMALLQGCANIAQVYLPEDGYMKEVVRVKMSGPGIMTFEPETRKVTVDTKQLSIWDKYVTPVLQEANGKAQGQVGIN